MVFSLVYLSTLLQPLTDDGLAVLLLECRSRNEALGVTGVLVHHNRKVMQLLEGREATVRDLYARISADPRHHGLLVIWTDKADHRRFPDWTMGTDALHHQTGQAARQQSHLGLAAAHGTPTQQDFTHRRNAALQVALASNGSLIRTLGLLTHGHDPETVEQSDGIAALHCRACRVARQDTVTYPCATALSALQDLERHVLTTTPVTATPRPSPPVGQADSEQPATS